MNAPDPINFGVRGMAAGLGLTEDEFRTAYRSGAVNAPDTVHLKEPRWSINAFGGAVAQRLPDSADALQRTILALEALLRAEHAEQ